MKSQGMREKITGYKNEFHSIEFQCFTAENTDTTGFYMLTR
ncbi:hypothetical protein Echvi_1264 [Echinicola vietnamensis DSM 17526]|uniref:Uncharacterized protein n=1 Tax=Echinicola vietnamensis (strain DSM 17526 / LMG 23754 / KMM 6221) TaxID=926556 RepID=L0FY34_ECHVK|nr:hypothetical protein Echvi_1264 [Echinicola vietnamensis DSM 17526]